MRNNFWFLLCGLLSVLAGGCGREPSGPPVATIYPVSGTVMLDGQPMASGDIIFASPGQGGSPIPVKDGKFDGKVASGDKRVEIRSYRPGKPVMMGETPTGDPQPENVIPERYNVSSTLTAKIEAKETKDLKFEVTSK